MLIDSNRIPASGVVRNRNMRTALVLTTALASFHANAAFAAAAQVNVTSSETATALNSQIVSAENAPSADIAVSVSAPAVISAGNVTLSPQGSGKGDGAITFTNTGNFGAVDATGAITDSVRISLSGVGTKAAANTATVSNSGLVTNGISATGFGGDVSITNGGTVYGGLSATGYGNVTVTTNSGGSVVTTSPFWAAFAVAYATPSSTTTAGITTTTNTGGNAEIDQNGNALLTDGTTPANLLSFSAVGNSTVNVGAKAGFVYSTAGAAPVTTVSGGNAPALSATTVTSESDVSYGAGASLVDIASNGSVTGILSQGAGGGSSVIVDGTVGTSGIQSISHATDSTSKSTETDDATGPTSYTTATSSTHSGGDASVTVGATGSVGSYITASGDKSASVVANGNVNGPITATQQVGYDSTDTVTSTPAGAYTEDYSQTFVPGAASIAVGLGVTVGGSLTAASNGDASVTTGANSIINGGVSINANPGGLSGSSSETYTPGTGSDYTHTYSVSAATSGGSASFSNAGYVDGPVTINAVKGITITNSGQVVGATYASTAAGAVSEDISTSDSHATTTASGITTTTNLSASSDKSTAITGDITGTYSGVNGEASFSPVSSGNIYQSASGASSVDLSGTVYGSIVSYAGVSANNSQDDTSYSDVFTTDGGAPASTTETIKSTASSSYSAPGGGLSAVTVSGLVSNALGGVDVYSQGTTGSTVNVAGGTVDGSVYSYAYGQSAGQSASSYEYDYVNGVETLYNASDNSSYTTTAGAAAGNVTGTGRVEGNLYVHGVASAASQIDAGANVTGSVNVTTGGTDGTSSSSTVYTYDPASDVATEVYKSTGSTSAAAASGNASANVDGMVGGSVYVAAARGNASASIQGAVDGSVFANSYYENTASSSETDYAGTSAGLTMTKVLETDTGTYVGGDASITVNTSAAFKGLGYGSTSPSVAGDVQAYGLNSASVTIGAGSLVSGYAEADADPTNYVHSVEYDYNAAGTSGTKTESWTYTPVGGTATLVNNGEVDGGAGAYGLTGASVTNNGTVNNYLEAYALDSGYTYTGVDNDFGNLSPSTRTVVNTWTYTPVGGAASLTNTGDLEGYASVAGATGTLTNSGTINGGVTLGASVDAGTYVQTVTSKTTSSPTPVYTAPTTLFDQTYTFNQNGTLVGDTYVRGADISVYNGTGYDQVQTSNVNATINLNAGSTTTGSFYGENDTDTVVNVNGANDGTTTLYLTSSNAYLPVSATNTTPVYSAGLVGGATGGSFALNVNSGRTEIAPITFDSGIFGINGDVTVGSNGTLVLGLLNQNAATGAGSSITSVEPTITGANLAVSGNLSSTGTLVVGLNGSLVQSPLFAGSISTDFLAPITTVIGSYGSLYTTPAAAALAGNPVSTPSTVLVDGNLNLAGTIQVYVPKGSIFLGDGSEDTTLFTVGGTITNTAKVSSDLNSAFVKLAAVTSGQDVDLKVTRVSYATAATSPNGAAAATALDKAIPGTVKVLADDAVGKRDYSTLAQFSNVEDMANVISYLDWSANTAQAAEIFNELSSASIYGSLANVRQNVAFEDQLDQLTQRRDGGKDPSVSLWLNPIGNFAKYGGTSSGAAKIDATSYGAAIGLDIGYNETGAFGFGFGYAKHNIDAKGYPASADANTYTLGAYWTQGFGPLTVNAKVAYGFSVFDAQRTLAMLSRTIDGHFRGSELDGSLGVSYTLNAGGFDVSPFGELALRHWHMNSFTETGGGGFGLAVNGASKTVFDPSIGVRLTTVAKDSDGFQLRPYGSVSYTFQGNAGTSRTVQYLGDLAAGDTFTLKGVNPKGYATVEAGLTTLVANKVSVSLGGSYGFGGSNNIGTVRALIGVKF